MTATYTPIPYLGWRAENAEDYPCEECGGETLGYGSGDCWGCGGIGVDDAEAQRGYREQVDFDRALWHGLRHRAPEAFV